VGNAAAAQRALHPVARVLALGWLSVALLGTAPAAAEEWAIVVHFSRKESVSLSDVAQIYMKKRRFWRDGAVIVPVNRSAESPARESFTRAVFASEAGSYAQYWNQQYFQGVLPPITLASSEAVLRFVASEPRAIGYVPTRLVDDSVHVVARYVGKPD
jgi:ABC-type phosphate transport system substrate-binding protein